MSCPPNIKTITTSLSNCNFRRITSKFRLDSTNLHAKLFYFFLLFVILKVGFFLKSKLNFALTNDNNVQIFAPTKLGVRSLSWLPLFVWILSFNSQLSWAIFSVWFCLWSDNINKVTAVHRVISHLALFWLLFGIYIKKDLCFCQQMTKTFFKRWRFVWNHGHGHFDFRENPTFIN